MHAPRTFEEIVSAENDAIDQKLILLAQKGNQVAFDRLVEKYTGKVKILIGRYVSNPVEIEDLTQETFIRAYLGLKKFRADAQFYTWLYRIAINTAKNYLIFTRRRPPPIDVDVDFTERMLGRTLVKDINSPEGLLLRDELFDVIGASIAALPTYLRMAYTLREFDEMTYEEIADALKCPLGTVRSRIFRAREIINQQIDNHLQQ